MTAEWPYKDPDEKLDYIIDWTARLSGDVIVTSTWTVPSGLTKVSDELDNNLAVVWFSDGVIGQAYTVTNRVTTQSGRIMEQSVRLIIKEK